MKARIQIFLDKGRDGILLKKLKIDPFKFDLRFENLVGIVQAFKTIAEVMRSTETSILHRNCQFLSFSEICCCFPFSNGSKKLTITKPFLSYNDNFSKTKPKIF